MMEVFPVSEVNQIMVQCDEEFERGRCMRVKCAKCKISDDYKEFMGMRIEEVEQYD